MEEFKDKELFVELTPEELEELKGGFLYPFPPGGIYPKDFFPYGIILPPVLLNELQNIQDGTIRF
ncbi:hypothetical protein [Coleofasciculus sp. F4-SAH-05]|uniref:hypothetical protein n=1 Tax=Coleofasciculus sp. F4-SAH-05 TaxID=3069525 RepID=UPI0032F41074